MVIANDARRAPVRDARGRERGPPPRDRHQQHALLLGAGPERRGAGDLRARASCALVDPTEGSDLLFELISATAGDARMGMGIVSVLRNVSDLRTRDPGDPGKLPAAPGGGGRGPRRARSAGPHHRLGRRSHPGHRFLGQPRHDEHARGAAVLRVRSAPWPRSSASRRTTRTSRRSCRTSSSARPGRRSTSGGVNLVDPKSGRSIPMEAVSGNVYGESAEVSAIVTILHDRTEAIEREQLYEQLKTASAQLERRVQEATSALVHQNELLRRQAIELEQASVAKSQFLANVSHDVRTPAERDPRLHEPAPARRRGPPRRAPARVPGDGSTRTPGTC